MTNVRTSDGRTQRAVQQDTRGPLTVSPSFRAPAPPRSPTG
jgi:hypothetical protein